MIAVLHVVFSILSFDCVMWHVRDRDPQAGVGLENYFSSCSKRIIFSPPSLPFLKTKRDITHRTTTNMHATGVGSDAEVCWEHERGCWEHEWGCWERSARCGKNVDIFHIWVGRRQVISILCTRRRTELHAFRLSAAPRKDGGKPVEGSKTEFRTCSARRKERGKFPYLGWPAPGNLYPLHTPAD